MKQLLPLFLLIALSSFALSGCLNQSKAEKDANANMARLEAISQDGSTPTPTTEKPQNQQNTQKADMDFSSYTNATELKIEDQQVGTGKEAQEGSQVAVHYTGYLTSGQVFDTSHKGPNQPVTFPLVSGGLIEGWVKGVAGMKEGGKRRLIIPPAMGYGASGIPGAIPGNAVLVFDIELVKVQ